MNNYFLITIYDYDECSYSDEWFDIYEYIKKDGIKSLNKYFDIETKFISVVKKFNDFFNFEYADSTIAAKIEVYDEENLDHYNDWDSDYYRTNVLYGLDGDYQKLQKLAKKNFNELSEVDKEFIYRCQCRRMCSFWFIDVSSMTYISSAMDPFFLHLYVNPRFNINEVFEKTESIYFYYDMDIYNSEDNYTPPENCGKKVILN